jgi:hypothetical protein
MSDAKTNLIECIDRYDAATLKKFRRSCQRMPDGKRGSVLWTAMATHSYAGRVRAPDFPKGLDWLNVARPLRIADLRGRLAIIDFWTFC